MTAPGEILTFARGRTFTAGTNLNAAAPVPLWRFLLPAPDDPVVVVPADADARARAEALAAGTPVVVERPTDGGWPATADPAPAYLPAVGVVPGAVRPGARALRRVRRQAGRLQRRIGAGRPALELAAEATLVDPHRPEPGDAVMVVGVGAIPRWVVEVTASMGLDVDPHRWQLVPPRGYRSQKVIFLLRTRRAAAGASPAGEPVARVALKVTQDPAYNHLLANEQATLERLTGDGAVPAGSVPDPIAVADHEGLLAVVQRAVDGETFSASCDATPQHPLAARVVSWIGELATATAVEVPSRAAADALAELAARVGAMYADPGLQRVLEGDAGAVDRLGSFPAVTVHGDLGHWNTLVEPTGRPVVLDWENAEAAGPPLWDLVYFLQTYAAWAAERRGRRYSPAVFARQLLAPTAWASWLWGEARRQAGLLGLPESLILPLARAGWAYLALKEGTRLPPDRLARGRYIRLLSRAARLERLPDQ